MFSTATRIAQLARELGVNARPRSYQAAFSGTSLASAEVRPERGAGAFFVTHFHTGDMATDLTAAGQEGSTLRLSSDGREVTQGDVPAEWVGNAEGGGAAAMHLNAAGFAPVFVNDGGRFRVDLSPAVSVDGEKWFAHGVHVDDDRAARRILDDTGELFVLGLSLTLGASASARSALSTRHAMRLESWIPGLANAQAAGSLSLRVDGWDLVDGFTSWDGADDLPISARDVGRFAFDVRQGASVEFFGRGDATGDTYYTTLLGRRRV